MTQPVHRLGRPITRIADDRAAASRLLKRREMLRLPLALSFALTIAATARADERLLEPAPPKLEERPTEQHWYGWQIIIADAATIGLTIATENVYVFTSSYLLGAPIVHGVHGRSGAAAGSVGLRVVLPLTGALIGAGAANCGSRNDQWFCGLSETAVGFGIGYLVASLVDASVLSWETRPKKSASDLSLAPMFAPTKSGSLFGVSGAF